MTETTETVLPIGDRLRALAAWFEEHPLAPIPFDFWPGMTGMYMVLPDDPEKAKEVLRNIGTFQKVFPDWSASDFHAKVTIAGMTITYITPRKNVCERKVVGHKVIPEVILPAQPSKVIPEHEEEIVEWDCHSVLAPEDETQEVGS